MTPFLDPDEIFLDSRNLPEFDRQQFEGQMEKPITTPVFYWLGIFLTLVGVVLISRTVDLQIVRGRALAARSENNTLRHIPIFSERGLITDRYGVELAWNDPLRRYRNIKGLAHLVGYIAQLNNTEAASGDYPVTELVGRDGVERLYNQVLRGVPGVRIEETDVSGELKSQYLLTPAINGQGLTLSVDARLADQLYRQLDELISQKLFVGGAGVILDVYTGEILALVSAPEYESSVLSAGADRTAIRDYLADSRHPFLNRAVNGLYAPGSSIKPFIASAALAEKVIDPAKQILSTGALTLPNPFDPSRPSVFKDWKAHGLVDMRRALAVSSDVYFYQIGGGFEDQPGLGIERIADYASRFGFGQATGLKWLNEEVGVVPTPDWKEKNFPGDYWRVGNTYHTAIGQYGFQVTPLQMARAVAAIANGGHLITPTILATPEEQTATFQIIPGLDQESIQVVKEGMRLSVLEGTAKGLNTSAVAIAAKTGTAEIGAAKDEVNSWVIGFFPDKQPQYAFAVVLERGASANLIGATAAMRRLIDWLAVNAPEYLGSN